VSKRGTQSLRKSPWFVGSLDGSKEKGPDSRPETNDLTRKEEANGNIKFFERWKERLPRKDKKGDAMTRRFSGRG